MDHTEVGRYWNANVEVWTRLVRAGYDTYRQDAQVVAYFLHVRARKPR